MNHNDFEVSPDLVEQVEKATIRMVTQAVYDYRNDAVAIFAAERDLAADIGEDLTREALDRMGVSKIDLRLYGKIDYKKARYVFHPEYSCRQALFVDSKAERTSGQATATIQKAQTSMRIRHIRAGQEQDIPGSLRPVIVRDHNPYLVTTVFVKYNYGIELEGGMPCNRLESITIAALPNGVLQDRYNLNCHDTFWLAGRNSPSRGEEFRVRISFPRLKSKARWRVQKILLWPNEGFSWDN